MPVDCVGPSCQTTRVLAVFAKEMQNAWALALWVQLGGTYFHNHTNTQKNTAYTALPFRTTSPVRSLVPAERPGQALAAEGGAAVDACDERRVARRERGVEERQQHAVRIVEERQQCGVARRLLGQMRRGSTPWAAARRVGRQGCTAGARRR